MTEIEPDSELDLLAQHFLQAGRRYREAVKKHCPKELGGVIWLKDGNEAVVYSESSRYNQQLVLMAHDKTKDELVFTERAAE